ncbi:hypothetical protein [Natrinema sp. SYSU A 869]|uniref:hypothetical protein n=1 Tax=Natrinema sp. SYSU A 869 TaxID=2871694 RepID=UPI001CA3D4DD|nr:hypothetical protein [Natrinema sp. SYSU A 869]
MTTADAITLFDHEDGRRFMKLGRYDATSSEEIEIVELENPFEEPREWTVKVSGHSAFPH